MAAQASLPFPTGGIPIGASVSSMHHVPLTWPSIEPVPRLKAAMVSPHLQLATAVAITSQSANQPMGRGGLKAIEQESLVLLSNLMQVPTTKFKSDSSNIWSQAQSANFKDGLLLVVMSTIGTSMFPSVPIGFGQMKTTRSSLPGRSVMMGRNPCSMQGTSTSPAWL